MNKEDGDRMEAGDCCRDSARILEITSSFVQLGSLFSILASSTWSNVQPIDGGASECRW